MRKTIFLFLFALLFLHKANAQYTALSADSIFYQMKKVADWQWRDVETNGWKNPKKDWTNGAMYTGMMAWARLANDETYYKKLIQVGEDNSWKIGNYRFFADDYCVGQLYSQLYAIYKVPKYIEDFKNLGDSLVKINHREHLEWKNNIHMREWAWCDALFMAPPALAYLSQATGDPKYLDKASELWWKSTAYLLDKDENLYYRDSRYFNKKEKNGAKVFWSRGNGWVIGGLVRVLAIMPNQHPDRERFMDLFKKMASKLAALQQPDGSWHASLLDPASYPSKETSGTGFICYAMAWGVNNGILPAAKYTPIIAKAWSALSSAVHANGKLGYVQAQGAAPDKVGYEDTDVYGTGAFLLAGAEVFRLNLLQKDKVVIKEVNNPSSITKEHQIVVTWKQISEKFNRLNPKNLVAKDAATGVTVPLKINYKGKSPKNVSITTNITAGASKFLEISSK